MRSSRIAAFALIVPVLMAARPAVAPKSHVVDKNHSEINFVADARLLSAHGFFSKWEADIQLDAQNLEASSVAITIDASSVDTRVTMRDNHLRSDAFLDVAKYPNITFKSISVKKTGENKLAITGDLTMRGVTKRIVVPATMVFYEKGAGRFRGEFKVNRMEYGVSFNPPVNPIEDEITVQWDMSIKEPTPAPAK